MLKSRDVSVLGQEFVAHAERLAEDVDPPSCSACCSIAFRLSPLRRVELYVGFSDNRRIHTAVKRVHVSSADYIRIDPYAVVCVISSQQSSWHGSHKIICRAYVTALRIRPVAIVVRGPQKKHSALRDVVGREVVISHADVKREARVIKLRVVSVVSADPKVHELLPVLPAGYVIAPLYALRMQSAAIVATAQVDIARCPRSDRHLPGSHSLHSMPLGVKAPFECRSLLDAFVKLVNVVSREFRQIHRKKITAGRDFERDEVVVTISKPVLVHDVLKLAAGYLGEL